MLVSEVKVGGVDPAGVEITDVYKKSAPHYAIYRTASRVLAHYADDEVEAKAQSANLAPLNPIRGEINGLIDGWRAGGPKQLAKAVHFDRRVADALSVALENDTTGALDVLKIVKTDIIDERTSWSRFVYLLAAFAASAIVILVVWLVLNRWSEVGGIPSNPAAWLLWFSLTGGTIGAFFSIAIGIRNRTVLTDLHLRDNVADAVLRVVIGAIAASVLVSLLKLKAVSFSLGTLSVGDTVDGAWLSALVVAFAGGFSERLIPDLLEKTAATVATASASVNTPAIAPAAAGAQSAGGNAAAGASPVAANDPGPLQSIRGDIEAGRQVVSALGKLGVGSQLVSKADMVAGAADQVLGTIDKVLQNDPAAPPAAQAASAATAVLGALDNAGLPGILGGAASVLSGALKLAGPAIAGLPGGPVGVVAGLVLGGLQVAADEQKFNAWKAALLAKPFDRSLLPDTVDGNTAQLALELSPLMAKRLDGSAPNVATELLRACLIPGPDGNPKSSGDLARDLMADAADDLGLRSRFASAAEMTEALEEYRGSAVFLRARDALAGQVAIPPIAGAAAASIDMGTLLTGALKMREDPRAGDALEKVVYVVQALRDLHLDPAKLMGVVSSGLEAGAAMVGTTRPTEERRNAAA
ncbi:MAG: hypothetical protein RQ966_06195 [Acetobacteraceae bacterium]|nr:hypothetical protein [Acetobacteraceae bacterium]